MSSVPTEVPTESTITSVTVFEQGAQIFRNADVTIGKGLSKIIFEKLPATLKRDTLQVGIKAKSADQEALLGGITLKGISSETKTIENEEYDAQTAARVAAQEKVKELESKIQALHDQKKVVQQKQKFVKDSFSKATAPNSQKEKANAMDPKYWEKMVLSTIKHKESTLADQRTVEAQISALEDEKGVLEVEVIGHVPEKKTSKEIVAVFLEAQEGVENLGIQLSYLIDEAKWTPTYDVRVATDEKGGDSDLNLTYNGLIQQWGSESWMNVRVDLSTAKPSMSGKQPVLQPWHISLGTHPSRERSHSMQRKAKNTSFDARDEILQEAFALGESSAPVAVEQADVNTTAISQSFLVKGVQTITNDRKEARVTLVQIPLKATFDYIAVPKEAEVAFARANVENTSEFFLLPGESSIFLNDQFIGKSTIPKVCPKEKFEVDVGRDEGVVIERKQLKRIISEEGGMLSTKKTIINYKYLLRVTNKKGKTIKIKVQEPTPVSYAGDIKVELLEPEIDKEKAHDPDANPSKDYQNILTFTLHPKAGQAESVHVAYKVTYPQDGRRIEGL